MPISNDLPVNDYYAYFGPDNKLHPNTATRIDNLNTRQYLDGIRASMLQTVKFLQGAPSVQMQHIPDDFLLMRCDVPGREERADAQPDVRRPQLLRDAHIHPDNDFYDSDDD